MGFRWPFSQPILSTAALPAGMRMYAIGDVHGEAGLFTALMAMIEQDSIDRGPADLGIVVLGDFIDRGPRSAELVSAMMKTDNDRLTVLKGNHEAALVDAYRGDERALGFWLDYGGGATLASFGGDPAEIDAARDDAAQLLALLHTLIDRDIVDWLDGLPLHLEVGDYFFVHAGVRPGVDLARQSIQDLLWIRDPFLSSRRDHGKVIVHGHTIDFGDVELGGTRIGVDTGAHETGRLTALGLEGEAQWTLEATPASPH